MFLLGLSDDFSSGILNIVVAVWFLSVGYLLVKNVNRRVRARASRSASCKAVESFLDARQEQALQRG